MSKTSQPAQGCHRGGVPAVAGTQESFLLQGLLWLGSCLSLWWLCHAVGWHPSFCPELVGLGRELSLCFWLWVHGHVTLLQPLAGTSGQGCLHGLRVALPSPLSPQSCSIAVALEITSHLLVCETCLFSAFPALSCVCLAAFHAFHADLRDESCNQEKKSNCNFSYARYSSCWICHIIICLLGSSNSFNKTEQKQLCGRERRKATEYGGCGGASLRKNCVERRGRGVQSPVISRKQTRPHIMKWMIMNFELPTRAWIHHWLQSCVGAIWA